MQQSSIRRVAVVGTGTIGMSWTATFLARGIDVGDAGDTAGEEMDGLAPQRGLQAVGDMPRDLAADVDRPLADARIKGDRPIDRGRRRLCAADHLDQRDQVRRVERMADDNALGMAAGRHETADQEPRRA